MLRRRLDAEAGKAASARQSITKAAHEDKVIRAHRRDREAAQPHSAADDAQPRLLTMTHITAMMLSSAQTTPTGLGSPKMLRPMRPRTDAAFSWLHGFVRSMTGRVGHPQGCPLCQYDLRHLPLTI